MIKIYKGLLDTIINKEEVKLLAPMIMIAVAQKLYCEGQADTFEASIDLMWTLVTKNKRNLTKRERDNLVELFQEYFNIEESLEYYEEIVLNKYEDDSSFIMLKMQDIVNLFVGEKRLDKIANSLAILLNIHSYFNGAYINKSKDELLEEVKHQYVANDIWSKKKSNTWFYNYTAQELEELASNFVAYPDVENLLCKRYNDDSNSFDSQLLARVNFDKYMKSLEDLGILCKVATKYGSYRNKAVFCRVEHREVVEALYDRLEYMTQMSKNSKDENK